MVLAALAGLCIVSVWWQQWASGRLHLGTSAPPRRSASPNTAARHWAGSLLATAILNGFRCSPSPRSWLGRIRTNPRPRYKLRQPRRGRVRRGGWAGGAGAALGMKGVLGKRGVRTAGARPKSFSQRHYMRLCPGLIGIRLGSWGLTWSVSPARSGQVKPAPLPSQ